LPSASAEACGEPLEPVPSLEGKVIETIKPSTRYRWYGAVIADAMENGG